MVSDAELLFIERILRRAGSHVLGAFGDHIEAHRKQDMSQIVTAIDVSSEKLLIAEIAEAFPDSSIIAEESGFLEKNPRDAWIIDPIDGTSNFANGLPWFGVMIAHITGDEVVSAGIYLPISDELYLGKLGGGSYKNGKRFKTPLRDDLSLSLIAFGTDGSERSVSLQQKAHFFQQLIPRILNFRCTNSVVDYCYTVDGRLGGAISLEGRIWDVAPIALIAKEAQCLVTDIAGQPLDLSINKANIARNFTLVLAVSDIHQALLSILKQ